jgi:hypothetical protein
MDYVIEEVFEILCDIDKILTFKFRLESDGEDQYREIIDSDYFEWCYEKYISEEGNNYENDYEEEGDIYFNDAFSVDMWNMYYCNEESVMDFIYETYLNVGYLPSPKN